MHSPLPLCSLTKHARLRGYTLLEMILVLIIIGILAAVMAEHYINVNSSVRRQRLEALANRVTEASSRNYTAYLLHQPVCTSSDQSNCYVVTVRVSCVTLLTTGTAQSLLREPLPSDIQISGSIDPHPSGVADACRLVDPSIPGSSADWCPSGSDPQSICPTVIATN